MLNFEFEEESIRSNRKHHLDRSQYTATHSSMPMNLKKRRGPNLSCAVNIENMAFKHSCDYLYSSLEWGRNTTMGIREVMTLSRKQTLRMHKEVKIGTILSLNIENNRATFIQSKTTTVRA